MVLRHMQRIARQHHAAGSGEGQGGGAQPPAPRGAAHEGLVVQAAQFVVMIAVLCDSLAGRMEALHRPGLTGRSADYVQDDMINPG